MRRVIVAWGVNPANVARLVDAPSDIHSARQIGAIPLAAAWAGTTDYEALQALAPAHTFRRVDEFLAWIKSAANHADV
jgi:phosphoglycolate phosphatase-like HAD superfamily hydrolase